MWIWYAQNWITLRSRSGTIRVVYKKDVQLERLLDSSVLLLIIESIFLLSHLTYINHETRLPNDLILNSGWI